MRAAYDIPQNYPLEIKKHFSIFSKEHRIFYPIKTSKFQVKADRQIRKGFLLKFVRKILISFYLFEYPPIQISIEIFISVTETENIILTCFSPFGIFPPHFIGAAHDIIYKKHSVEAVTYKRLVRAISLSRPMTYSLYSVSKKSISAGKLQSFISSFARLHPTNIQLSEFSKSLFLLNRQSSRYGSSRSFRALLQNTHS